MNTISTQINLEQFIIFFIQLPANNQKYILEILQACYDFPLRTAEQKIRNLEKFKGKLSSLATYTPSKNEFYEQ